jgi:hypothetical protein
LNESDDYPVLEPEAEDETRAAPPAAAAEPDPAAGRSRGGLLRTSLGILVLALGGLALAAYVSQRSDTSPASTTSDAGPVQLPAAAPVAPPVTPPEQAEAAPTPEPGPPPPAPPDARQWTTSVSYALDSPLLPGDVVQTLSEARQRAAGGERVVILVRTTGGDGSDAAAALDILRVRSIVSELTSLGVDERWITTGLDQAGTSYVRIDPPA